MLFKELEASFTPGWTQKLSHPFNCIAVDSIFKYPGLSLAVAGEDGKVYIYQISSLEVTKSVGSSSSSSSPGSHLKLLSEHETKGDALQAMVVHDVTKVHANDLITCDSSGLLTVFCNGQILSRLSISDESLDCLQVSQEPDGSVAIVAGGDAGLLTGVHPSKELWRLSLLQTPSFGPVGSSAVTCIASFDLPSSSSSSSSVSTYVFVADSAHRLHVLHGGKIVLALQTPAVIRAMTIGSFVTYEETRASNNNFASHFNSALEGKGPTPQIALGCEDGAIYILENFEIIRQPYAKCDHSINYLRAVPVSNSSISAASGLSSAGGGANNAGSNSRRRSSSSGAVGLPHPASVVPAVRIHDALILAGNFNRVLLYHAGKCAASTQTQDWVCSLAFIGQMTKERTFGLVIGCLDQSVSYVEMSLT